MELLEKIKGTVQKAGEIVLSAHNLDTSTSQKTSAADLVTVYDKQVEEFLKRELLTILPGAVFYGEEETENGDPRHGWAFIVDPIDGTTNFVRGLHHSAVSVALAKDGAVQYAVVLNPYKNELFTAVQGQGAFLNSKAIHVSDCSLSQGIFAMGSAPYHKELHDTTLRLTSQLFDCSCDFRRMGSAALDLCDVACGRVEAYFEYVLSPWDYAAGSLIITEAGGHISTLAGTPIRLDQGSSIWASNQVNRNILKQMDL